MIPIGQWGAQEVLPAYSARPHLVPASDHAYKVGDPVDLSDLADQPLTREVLHEATDRIMAAITALVADCGASGPPPYASTRRSSGIKRDRQPPQARSGSRR